MLPERHSGGRLHSKRLVVRSQLGCTRQIDGAEVSKIIEQLLGHLFTNASASVGREDFKHADECAMTAVADRTDSTNDSSGCFVDCENHVTASFEHAEVLVRTGLSRPTLKEAGKHRCIDVIKRLCISDGHRRSGVSVSARPAATQNDEDYVCADFGVMRQFGITVRLGVRLKPDTTVAPVPLKPDTTENESRIPIPESLKLAVRLLPDGVLLQLFVQIAAGSADNLRGL
jgi:hypothetical protein